MATYAKMMNDGRYEYGLVTEAADRRHDSLVKLGEADTYEAAVSATNTIKNASTKATGAAS